MIVAKARFGLRQQGRLARIGGSTRLKLLDWVPERLDKLRLSLELEPGLQVPYSQTWTAGWQRKLTRDLAIEARYVGTRSLQSWQTYGYNDEENIIENGFLDEFKLAQQNLQANIAAGRGANFRYFGPGTGTSLTGVRLEADGTIRSASRPKARSGSRRRSARGAATG